MIRKPKATPLRESEAALTIYEVAEVLGVSHILVRKEIKQGRLRATRVGSIWRISPKALRQYMGDD